MAASANFDKAGLQQIFLAQMDDLLLPAFLLTGTHEQAAECFLEAWEECNEQPPFIARFALGVAKRAIVKSAIRRIAADLANSPVRHDRGTDIGVMPGVQANFEDGKTHVNSAAFQRAMLTLDTFHRAALVLRLYERYSPADAALLLGVSRQTLESGWRQGLLSLLDRLNLSGACVPTMVDLTNGVEQVWKREAAKIPA